MDADIQSVVEPVFYLAKKGGFYATMKYRTIFTLIAFLALTLISNVQTGIADTSGNTDRTAERKVASVAQDSPPAIIAQDKADTKYGSSATPVHFEPLLLLLLGSTLFSAGTAIKFVVSRKFDRKSIGVAVSKRLEV
ncbi:MAG TPA: hypothetical protein VLR92_02070 [Blastocatellia bacterium]|nr:hypothetical protein [Blastocatellia bacterium]